MALRLASTVSIGLHVPHHAVLLEHCKLLVRDRWLNQLDVVLLDVPRQVQMCQLRAVNVHF